MRERMRERSRETERGRARENWRAREIPTETLLKKSQSFHYRLHVPMP
jgi:hypothetical protein